MAWNPTSPENGKNLCRRDGTWHLRFSGNELKISEVQGRIHSIAHEFPRDLVDLLEEWLYRWRPILVACQKAESRGIERLDNGQEFVFLNSLGQRLTPDQVTLLFKHTTYKFAGVAVNPHMIRTIWATEYIKETNNFVDAAYMLGDTVQTVINNYAKLLDEDCSKRASLWISRKLNGETQDTIGEGNDSTLPKLVYPRGR